MISKCWKSDMEIGAWVWKADLWWGISFYLEVPDFFWQRFPSVSGFEPYMDMRSSPGEVCQAQDKLISSVQHIQIILELYICSTSKNKMPSWIPNDHCFRERILDTIQVSSISSEAQDVTSIASLPTSTQTGEVGNTTWGQGRKSAMKCSDLFLYFAGDSGVCAMTHHISAEASCASHGGWWRLPHCSSCLCVICIF